MNEHSRNRNIQATKNIQGILKTMLKLSLQRWLKPNLDVVTNFTPLRSCHWKTSFVRGLKSFKMLFLNIRVSKRRVRFVSSRDDGWWEVWFLKNSCLKLMKKALSLHFVTYVLLQIGVILQILQNDQSLLYERHFWRDSRLRFWLSFWA